MVLLIATAFVQRYVFRYYLHYSELSFTNPIYGAANYWRMRGWLLLHITSGMLALLLGPLQFSRRLRQRYLPLHRIAGRIYVAAVLSGCVTAIPLALSTTFGRGFGFGLSCLALVWASTTLMAFYAALQGQISIHNEWMARSYVVTFAFVIFRILTDYPLMTWLPEDERASTASWLCWAIPLFFTNMTLQLKHMRTKNRAKGMQTRDIVQGH